MTSRPRVEVEHVGDARIVGRRALRYAAGADPATGRPAHVRAASGLAWQARAGQRVLVAPQDDTSFLAVFAPPEGEVSAIVLDHAPRGARVFEKRLGTKEQKLDLESIAAVAADRALVVGSGSHANRRSIVDLRGESARVVHCEALYEALRARTDFAGSELNVEGATVVGDQLVLANRGNGAPSGALSPIDALVTIDLAELLAHLDGGPLPRLGPATRLSLGELSGARLGVTDLATAPDGSLWLLAAAERSPNAYDDGEVVACAVGTIDPRTGAGRLWALRAEDGTPSRDKPEGLAIAERRADGLVRAWACLDADDPDRPSELVALEIPAG